MFVLVVLVHLPFHFFSLVLILDNNVKKITNIVVNFFARDEVAMAMKLVY